MARVRLAGVTPAASPSIPYDIVYGSKGPQMSRTDTTPTASVAQAKELQVVVGSILYYARAADPRMLEAVSFLSCLQSNPTTLVMAKMERLLGYASAHADAQLIIHSPDMLLTIFSDASFNSRPNSKSVAGGYHFLGRRRDPDFLNAPIPSICATIPVACAAVSEAEYGGVFVNYQAAVEERTSSA